MAQIHGAHLSSVPKGSKITCRNGFSHDNNLKSASVCCFSRSTVRYHSDQDANITGSTPDLSCTPYKKAQGAQKDCAVCVGLIVTETLAPLAPAIR
jgi:hypothetical protein